MQTHDSAIRHIALSINQIDGVYALFARKLGVNENTLAFLYALSDGQPHSQKEISDAWLIPRTTINSIVKAQLAEEHIVFCAKPHAKEKALMLTERGQAYADALLRDLFAAEANAMRGTLARFSPDFLDALADFGSRLHAEFDRIPARTKESSPHVSD